MIDESARKRNLVEASALTAATLAYSNGLTLWALRHGESPDRFFGAVDTFLGGRWPSGAQPVSGKESHRRQRVDFGALHQLRH